MNKKRYLVFGLAFVGAAAIGLSGWMYAGSASALPGNTCTEFTCHPNPNATTTTAKPTTTTAKPATTTTKPQTTTTQGNTTTTKAGTSTTSGATTTTTAAGTGTTAASTSTTATAGSAGATSFSDVPSTHPYNTAITDMVMRQVIGGDGDGTFKPDLPVTREDFATMMVKALGLTVNGNETSPFTDVVAGQGADPSSAVEYVAVCFTEGFTVGKTPTTFAPDENLSRQQLITMVVRAAKLPDSNGSFTPPFSIGQFSPDEHYANAAIAASVGLLDGLQGLGPDYDFYAPATRGEVSFLLYNLLNRT